LIYTVVNGVVVRRVNVYNCKLNVYFLVFHFIWYTQYIFVSLIKQFAVTVSVLMSNSCFNAGLYCTGFYGCQDCLNRPKYEYTVKTSKRQIEYRYLVASIAKDSTTCHWYLYHTFFNFFFTKNELISLS